jgi:Spy/CpxP family protein refolding chaperone
MIMRYSLILTVVLASVAAAQSGAPATRPSAEQAEAAYTQTIEKRTQEILDLLTLTDAAQKTKVHNAIVAQYRALRDWHDANDQKLKDLSKDGASAHKEEILEIRATLKTLHDQYLSKLAAANLTSEQVEKIKDKMTYGVVQVTYNGFCDMLPTLTDAQKAKILETLKEAREEAMDEGSSEAKHAVFGRYKGRINNYLSREGYDLAKASKEWQERLKQQQAR